MIALTGASGFIGRHLLNSIIEKFGVENVIAITSTPIEGIQCIIHHNYNYQEVFKNIQQQVKIVIHAGAFTPKAGSEANDWRNSNSNIINTHDLLSALPVTVEQLVFLSTLDVYGPDVKITEETLVKPMSLYGHSKAYCEQMIESWSKQSGKLIQVLRVGHVYGPGEEEYKKIIPVTMLRILREQAPQIWGKGDEVRSFIYIDDLVAAILASLQLKNYQGPINLVSEQSTTVHNIIKAIQAIAGSTAEIEYQPLSSQPRNLYFDNSKMKTLLVEEKISLVDGLTKEWNYLKKTS